MTCVAADRQAPGLPNELNAEPLQPKCSQRAA